MIDNLQESGEGKPDYTSYVNYLEARGWSREQLSLDEINTNLVTINGVTANATSTAIVDILTPSGQKISIMGVQQIPRGADARTGHSLRVRFSDSSDNEIHPDTKIRITKEKPSEAVVQLGRVFYADISLTKTPGTPVAVTVTRKTHEEWYRFVQGIELNGNEHFRIYPLNTKGTIAAASTPAALPTTSTLFSLDMDLWTQEY